MSDSKSEPPSEGIYPLLDFSPTAPPLHEFSVEVSVKEATILAAEYLPTESALTEVKVKVEAEQPKEASKSDEEQLNCFHIWGNNWQYFGSILAGKNQLSQIHF